MQFIFRLVPGIDHRGNRRETPTRQASVPRLEAQRTPPADRSQCFQPHPSSAANSLRCTAPQTPLSTRAALNFRPSDTFLQPSVSSLAPARLRTLTPSSSEPNANPPYKTDCPRHTHCAESTGTGARVRERTEIVHTPSVRTLAPKSRVFDQSRQNDCPTTPNRTAQ